MSTLNFGVSRIGVNMVREIAVILSIIGFAIIAISYIWLLIIGYRVSVGWLIGIFFLWIFFYPPFLFKHWDKAKNNFFLLLAGLIVILYSFLILVVTNPNRVT